MCPVSINNKKPFAHVLDNHVAYGLLGVFLIISEDLINSEVPSENVVLDLHLAFGLLSYGNQDEPMFITLEGGTSESASLVRCLPQAIKDLCPVLVHIDLRGQSEYLEIPVDYLDIFDVLNETKSLALFIFVVDLNPIIGHNRMLLLSWPVAEYDCESEGLVEHAELHYLVLKVSWISIYDLESLRFKDLESTFLPAVISLSFQDYSHVTL
jgi:hypothetical protein